MTNAVKTEITIAWGHQDSLGHVNNARYFTYFESARIAYLEEMGVNLVSLQSSMGPILAQIECQFMKPVVYPDVIEVNTWTEKLGNTSCVVKHSIYSQSQKAVVAEGSSVIVLVEYGTGAKTPIPDEVRSRIAERHGIAERG